MSGQGHAVRDITSLMKVDEDYVRDVIYAFNERGFDALDPKRSRGARKRSVTDPRTNVQPSAQTWTSERNLNGTTLLRIDPR